MKTSTPLVKVNTNVMKEVTFNCTAYGNPQPQVIWVSEGGVLNDKCNTEGELSQVFGGEAALDYDDDFMIEVPIDPLNGYLPQSCEIQIIKGADNAAEPQTTTTLLIIKRLDSESITSTDFTCIGENNVINMIEEKKFVKATLELEGTYC